MTNSPLRQLLFVLVGVLLAGIAVLRLTHHPTPLVPGGRPAPPAAAAPRTVAVQLTLTTTSPAVIQARDDQGVSLSEVHDQISRTLDLRSGQKTPLILHVEWKDASRPQALHAVATSDGDTLADLTLWGSGSADDVLTIPVP